MVRSFLDSRLVKLISPLIWN